MDNAPHRLPATDIGAVHRALNDPDGFAALPSRLPDQVLLCLVRDMDRCASGLVVSMAEIEGPARLAQHHWGVIQKHLRHQSNFSDLGLQTMLTLMEVLRRVLKHEVQWRISPPPDEGSADHLLIWAIRDVVAALPPRLEELPA